ncbi:hypothetical protein [Actinoplanes awajinensis]|uniref:DUF998 domain-containing protein n=1 Tax=Actinoplanes awajinensis subsp. mycoplanecinus TaxID=135947 RepID=A0A117ML67_9ACTN|nr:hypothetical protein [Actinoplanes awajinensis]KUL23502.1 hypothetical protein ADL15_45855 [Actinoplanes awajinensis subsp. mycoplanecinus]
MLPRAVGTTVAAGTGAAAAISLAAGVTTPVRSGPNCTGDCVRYPYLDAAAFVPRDYLWMYPAVITALFAVLLAVCLDVTTPAARRWASRAGLCLAAIGAGTLVLDYALQLTVLQPGLLAGETAGLSPLSQYNPHGVFIGLENAGYAEFAVAFAFLGYALLRQRSRAGRAAGWILAAGAAATLSVLIVFAAVYRERLDYHFEVISIGLVWLTLIVGGPVLAGMFARGGHEGPPASTR